MLGAGAHISNGGLNYSDLLGAFFGIDNYP
jgi:hypothetical protein